MRTYQPRPWPYIAREARDGAAEQNAAALNNLVPLMEIVTDPAILRPIALAVRHVEESSRHLEAVGAPTRPVPL
jgi:hypothetical protein